MIQVDKFHRITEEKYRCIVSYHIPVSVFCVKFKSKSADISFRIGCPSFPGNCGETSPEKLKFPTALTREPYIVNVGSKEKELIWIEGTTRRFKDGYNWFGRYPDKVLSFLAKYMD